MHAVVRVFPLALVFAASLLRGAEEETLPPIFAPKERPAPAILSRPRAEAAPVSEEVRNGLNLASYQALATAKPFEAPNAPTGRTSLLPEPGNDTTLMRPFVVRSVPLVVRERAIPDEPLLDFLKTGRFYHAENMEVALKLKILQEPGLGWGQEFTRGEIQFSFRW
jgi:hypothetical protein